MQHRTNWKALNPLRPAYLWIRDVVMARSGLQPFGTYWLSRTSSHTYRDDERGIPVPNLAGQFHGVLVQFWERHGLGRRCLLVSENGPTKAILSAKYPDVTFVTADLFPELTDARPGSAPDFRWDVCSPPPPELGYGYDAVVCHALLEHVIAPTAAMANMFKLLGEGGVLYAMTHTPSFHLHRYPRDYCRFHHDWFEDLPAYVGETTGVAVTLEDMYSRRGVVCVAYRRICSDEPA
ncbi:MAG TPA: methyltransferase domain-containing protein [Gemmatimonadaceae bacterium]|nr:methyltransferase domain-containing protein [Gemmatimonadaceae bacterium]